MSNVIKRESPISKSGALVRLRQAWQAERAPIEIRNNDDGDAWSQEERGEDYGYARQHQQPPRQALKYQQSARQAQAQRAYQVSKYIAAQRVTHAPFYMETLGVDQPSSPGDHDPLSSQDS